MPACHVGSGSQLLLMWRIHSLPSPAKKKEEQSHYVHNALHLYTHCICDCLCVCVCVCIYIHTYIYIYIYIY